MSVLHSVVRNGSETAGRPDGRSYARPRSHGAARERRTFGVHIPRPISEQSTCQIRSGAREGKQMFQVSSSFRRRLCKGDQTCFGDKVPERQSFPFVWLNPPFSDVRTPQNKVKPSVTELFARPGMTSSSLFRRLCLNYPQLNPDFKINYH